MSVLKIVMIDKETGHTVKTIEREWEGENATDAAADVVEMIDTFSDGVTTEVDDQ